MVQAAWRRKRLESLLSGSGDLSTLSRRLLTPLDVKKLLKYRRLVIRMVMASSTRKNSKFTTSRSVKISKTTTRQESLRKELTKRLLLRL